MSKGLRQTAGPQLILRAEIAIGPAFAGALVKNVTSPTVAGEADLLLGIRPRFGGFDWTVGMTYRHAIDPATGSDPDAIEFTASASRRFGRVSPRMSATWSRNDFGRGGRSIYIEAGVAVNAFANASLSAAVARRSRDIGADYVGVDFGVSYTPLNHITADLRFWHRDRARFGEIYRDRLIFSLRARF